MDGLREVLGTLPWFAWIAIVAIAGGAVREVMKLSHRHRERMEMIQQGMDPGDPPKD
jgi:hypothetical protein